MSDVTKQLPVMEAPLLLRIEQVRELTQLSRSKLYEEIAAGSLPAVHFGRSVRVRRQDLEQWIERQAAASNGG
jgi:excisionase family DNA binding protein